MIARLKDIFDRGRQYEFYGLNDLDRRLFRIIRKRRGFFIEAGANDGISQSNTLFFERFRGWKGLLIEPHPVHFEQCRANRSQCIVENCLLGSRHDAGQEVVLHGCGLMSVVEGSLAPEEQARHLKVGAEIQQLTTQQQFPLKIHALSDILDRHGIARVDLLSLDVEGYEAPALRGLDMQRHRPTHILVECKKRDEVHELLQPYYQEVAQLSHHDYLYQSREN